MAFTLAIVGRPNVGKSTLFNRLVGRRTALTDHTPGLTRDRREGEGHLFGLGFRVIDTAGLEEAVAETLEARMFAQTETAVDEADVVLLLIDARAGVTPVDEHFANWLRRAGPAVVLVANKCEGRGGASGVAEAYALGLGEPIAISAEHGEGMADLHEAVVAAAGELTDEADGGADAEGRRGAGALGLAVVGRPNVGKSTLVNRLIGEDRVLTGPEPGVTRDAISVEWRHGGRAIRLVDTAGLRRKARVVKRLEKLSVSDTLKTIRFADVVVVVIDATEVSDLGPGLHRQDLAIADMVAEEGRALVIAVNKWDLVEDGKATLSRIRDSLERSLPQVKGVSLVTVSALHGKHLGRLMKAVFEAEQVWMRRLPTGPLNRWLAEVTARHPPPVRRGRRVRLRYMTQVKARPPTFAVFVSRPEGLPESYLRYLTNGLRQSFDLPGAPIRLVTRKGRNPYAPP